MGEVCCGGASYRADIGSASLDGLVEGPTHRTAEAPRIGNLRGGGDKIGGRIDAEDLARVGRGEDSLGQRPGAAADI
jgi:hypothetical protein